MNDFYEMVWIDVFGENRITVGYALEPESCEEGEEEAEIIHVCEIMAIAMGRELARTFEPETAKRIALHCAEWLMEEIRREKK